MPQALKLIVIALASAIAGAAALNQYAGNSCQVDIQQQNTALLDEKIAQLQEENNQLHIQLKQKNATPSSPLSQAEQQPAANNNASSPEKTAADEQLLRPSENFSNWLANSHKEKGSFNLHEEMQRRFAAESIDPDWAETQEQEYLTLFSQNPELAGLALRETQCRTQQCALTISIGDIDHANALLEKMTKTLQEKNRHPLIVATPDEQQGITTLYIGRDDSSFDFN